MVIREALNAHVATLFDVYAATNRQSTRLLTLNLFMEPIVTYVLLKKYLGIRKKKHSTMFASRDPIGTVETCRDTGMHYPSVQDPV